MTGIVEKLLAFEDRDVPNGTGDGGTVKLRVFRNPDGKEAADIIEGLLAVVEEANAALNAMAAQVDAEWRSHDKVAARHDAIVTAFRAKVYAAIAKAKAS